MPVAIHPATRRLTANTIFMAACLRSDCHTVHKGKKQATKTSAKVRRVYKPEEGCLEAYHSERVELTY